MTRYILDDAGNPVPEPDLLKWGRWLETAKRIVRQDRIAGYFISTVFLALDYNFTGRGRPILWETMIFPKTGMPEPRLDHFQLRYTSREEALKGHQRIVQMLTS